MNHTNQDVQISKTMSWILRHGMNELKLKPDNLGRIPLQTLVNLPQMKNIGATISIVKNIVNFSDKKRFRLDEINGILMIGANQGHSKEIGNKIDSEQLMTRITKPVELCVHGTYSKAINKIKESGLKTMARSHIHFASGYPSDATVISGARTNANVFVILDMEKALSDGIGIKQDFETKSQPLIRSL